MFLRVHILMCFLCKALDTAPEVFYVNCLSVVLYSCLLHTFIIYHGYSYAIYVPVYNVLVLSQNPGFSSSRVYNSDNQAFHTPRWLACLIHRVIARIRSKIWKNIHFWWSPSPLSKKVKFAQLEHSTVIRVVFKSFFECFWPNWFNFLSKCHHHAPWLDVISLNLKSKSKKFRKTMY